MQISTRGRYAVMALVELAARERGGCGRPVTLAEIAGSQQLSLCYLEQLFGKLRRAGLVASARGPGGGYRLGRPAGRIPVADILEAVEEELRATRCAPGSGGCLHDAAGGGLPCRTHDLWDELGRQIQLFLAGVSLADVLEGRVLGRAIAAPELAAE